MEIVGTLEIGVSCTDLDRLVEFYVGVLGCRLVSITDVPAATAKAIAMSATGYRVARVQLPSGERLKLLQPHTPPTVSPPSSMALDRRNATYLTFLIDDFAGLAQRLVDAGAELFNAQAPYEIRAGIEVLFARDPEQNLLEFVRYADLAQYRSL